MRHSHSPEGPFTVRLACIRPAASVHPEPGSISSLSICISFFLFSVLTRIYLLELIRFFYTYLSDFAWIILSKNFSTYLFSLGDFVVELDCKDTNFLISCKKKMIFFNIFLIVVYNQLFIFNFIEI